jgi:hypothetical protein
MNNAGAGELLGRRLLLALLLSGGPIGCRGEATAHNLPPLRLEVAKRHVLPDTFAFAGATIGPDASLLAWSFNQPYVIRLEANGNQSVLKCPASQLPIGAVHRSDGTVEILDAALRALCRLKGDAAVPQLVPISIDGDVINAVPAGDEWVAVVRVNQPAGIRVVAIGGNGDSRIILSVAGDSLAAALSHSDGEAVVTFRDPERGIILARLSDSTNRRIKPVSTDWRRAHLDSVSAGPWVALPALHVRGELLQTLADVTTDKRVVLVVDSTGKIARHSRLQGLIGFVAAETRQRLVAALHILNVTEVILYQWQ